jgi:hypothetical protein
MNFSWSAFSAIWLAVSCTSAHDGSLSADADAGLRQCTYPASMVPPSEQGAWTLGHALLVCHDGSAGTVCLSDDGRTCPGNFVSADGTCINECGEDEYAVEYGGPGPGPSPVPPLPAGCHSPRDADVDFDGQMNVCCPCE